MTRKQLEEKRDGLEAQMRWAVLHSAGQELLDLLRVENDRLAVLMDEYHRTALDPSSVLSDRTKPVISGVAIQRRAGSRGTVYTYRCINDRLRELPIAKDCRFIGEPGGRAS
jgi:hypothetical protein